MTRELRKAAKGKQNDVRCTIEQDMVVFENRKEKIIRSYIVNVRRNRKHRIIVVATKAWKRQPGQIFAMKFSNDDDFHEFFEILMEAARSEETRRPEQKWRSPYLNFINLFPRDSTVSDYENLLTPPPLKEKRNSVAFSLPRSSYTPTPHTPVQKIHHTRSSFTQTSSLPMLPISMDAATYVTTDVLVKHGHSSSSNSSGSVSAKDVYTKEEKITKRKDKDHTEMKLLTYEPNKVNENLYSISNRSAFTSASSSSSSLPSPSTSTMDSIVKNNLAQILRNNLLNNIFSCKRSGCSSSSDSSSSSSYSTPSSTIRVERAILPKDDKQFSLNHCIYNKNLHFSQICDSSNKHIKYSANEKGAGYILINNCNLSLNNFLSPNILCNA
ncbi:hypothetical protein EGR_05999 [Echinococcus granulosus]|uniref:DUF5734 domain-containing protein n=1 Tax=Echinococcus granulosus TaxID=6210 RepID=W6UE48_ECHGR|nr:hypothetical protein EGR_05999 [Echinococcus granulosus]EUB59136.1 hypothetical protein EGR_05999 [Echinococcus granulosus]